jgi:excisionase family DNA binding protein
MHRQRLSNNEAAEFLGVNSRTLTNWRHLDNRELPYYKVGRRVVYDLADLMAYLASRRVGQPQEKVSA